MDEPVLLGGKYQLGAELSRGGMGRLHVALDVARNVHVAIKRAHDEHDRERLVQEARLAGQLDHRNIVRVLDACVDDDPYLVLELLEGETLRARLDRGPLGLDATIAIVRGIAGGLTAAHAAGIVHRDLKPENVFLAGDTVKLLDFGIAKAPVAQRVLATTTGTALGTPAYMSPEQAVGDREVDHASDLWALGVITYECLVGHRPFEGDSLGELVLQICAWPLPVPSRQAAVPAGFDAWFATACHRERTARFATAGAQAAALERLSSPQPRRRTGIVLTLAAVAALAIIPTVTNIANTTNDAATVPAAIAVPRIVVAPVEAADASTGIVATEELIERLAHQALHVVARRSTVRTPSSLVATDLHTALTVDDAHLVHARIVEAVDGLELVVTAGAWRASVRGHDIEQLCDRAARALATHFNTAPRPSAPLHDPAAYASYRTARFHALNNDPVAAIAAYEVALAIDPQFTDARIGIVDAALLLPWFGHDRAPAHTRARAESELAGDDARAFVARGRVAVDVDRDYAAGERAFRAAIERDPDLAIAHERLGDVLALRRSFDAALGELDRAITLDPLVARHHMYRARTLYHAGRFRDAVAAADRTLALNPSEPFAAFIRGFALVKLGAFDDGLAAVRAEPMWLAPAARPIAAAHELWVAHARGDRATVTRLRDEIDRDVPRVSMFMLAFVMATLDEPHAPILDALELAYDRHDPYLPLAAALPELAALRDEPRFRALLARMHL